MCFSTLECVNLSNTPLIFEKYGIIFKMNDSEMTFINEFSIDENSRATCERKFY